MALAAAVLSKFFPVILAPSIWRPRRGDIDWRFPVAGVLTVAGLYLPYLGAGARVLGYLPGYAVEEKLVEDFKDFYVDRARAALEQTVA